MFSISKWLSDLVEKAVLDGVMRAARRLFGDTPDLHALADACGETPKVEIIERTNGIARRVKN